MIGKHHAGAIFRVDEYADLVLEGVLSFDNAVDKLMRRFSQPKFQSVRADFAYELNLTMTAPTTQEFPPTAEIEAIKVRQMG